MGWTVAVTGGRERILDGGSNREWEKKDHAEGRGRRQAEVYMAPGSQRRVMLRGKRGDVYGTNPRHGNAII